MSKLDISTTAVFNGPLTNSSLGILGSSNSTRPYGYDIAPSPRVVLFSGAMPTQEELDSGLAVGSSGDGTWGSQILLDINARNSGPQQVDAFDRVELDGDTYLRMFLSITGTVEQAGTATWFMISNGEQINGLRADNTFIGDITTPDALTPGAMVMENPVLEVGQNVNVGPILIKIPRIFTW